MGRKRYACNATRRYPVVTADYTTLERCNDRAHKGFRCSSVLVPFGVEFCGQARTTPRPLARARRRRSIGRSPTGWRPGVPGSRHSRTRGPCLRRPGAASTRSPPRDRLPPGTSSTTEVSDGHTPQSSDLAAQTNLDTDDDVSAADPARGDTAWGCTPGRCPAQRSSDSNGATARAPLPDPPPAGPESHEPFPAPVLRKQLIHNASRSSRS
ncbi:hypothetical protein SAMN04490239_0725 [Rhodococcus koreensis]|uniref:Uncharacterized protein n=1 Tax=Rhodococcus koreensis TaxID=99653 RepID=A0A1H4IJE0_9NOCA|nr:hypothetical protein SAMN04490239_0725 [Rhodococcus koreensis]